MSGQNTIPNYISSRNHMKYKYIITYEQEAFSRARAYFISIQMLHFLNNRQATQVTGNKMGNDTRLRMKN
jgi:hypothetical protein